MRPVFIVLSNSIDFFFSNGVFVVDCKIGFRILYCGKIGNASTLKVVTNFLASVNLLSLGEALMVCKKYGLDLKKAYHGIKTVSYTHLTLPTKA